MEIKKLIEEFVKLNETQRLYCKLLYNGKEIDTFEISRFLGTTIPEDFDTEKFEIKVGDNTILETAERYLSVEPGNSEFNDTFSASVVLYEGDKPIQSFGIDPRIVQDRDEDEIREFAKDHFENITDDIRVVWF